jgi:replicative DNA helicase
VNNGNGNAAAAETAGKRPTSNVQRPMSNRGGGQQQLPQDLQAEEGVLGAMINGGAAVIEEVRALLTADSFYHPFHNIIFTGIVNLQTSGSPADLITLTSEMRDCGWMDQFGGEAQGITFITHLITVGERTMVLHYARIVREKEMLRRMIADCNATVRRCYEEQDDAMGVLHDLQSNVIEIGQLSSTADALKHIAEFVPGAVQEIEATYHNRGNPVGLASGFVDLDRMTGGFQAPLTYYIGGRPAMGKSSVLVEVADYLGIPAIASKDRIGIFSVEMTGRQLAKRILCNRAEINLQRLRDGFLAKDTMPKLKAEAERVAAGNIWIDDTGGLSIFEFRARARRGVMKHGWKLILIDYLQRMRSTSKRAQGSRELEINEIAQGISETAKELNVPIIVLVQLNRENEKRTDKTPQLSDLRESGSIEQEARFVGLLHRPVYYALSEAAKLNAARKLRIFETAVDPVTSEETPKIGNDGEPIVDLEAFEQYAELHVVKQNEGPVGTIRLRFIKEFARLEGVTEKLFSNRDDERQHV